LNDKSKDWGWAHWSVARQRWSMWCHNRETACLLRRTTAMNQQKTWCGLATDPSTPAHQGDRRHGVEDMARYLQGLMPKLKAPKALTHAKVLHAMAGGKARA
jgi:hypothetical protein